MGLIFHDWPAEHIEILRRMAPDGASARQIANEIGVSRAAVIGKMRRLGIPFGNNRKSAAYARRSDATPRLGRPSTNFQKPLQVDHPTDRKKQRAARKAAVPVTRERIAFLDATELTELPPEDAKDAVSIFDLTATTCRWPIGDPRSLDTIKFCGKHAGKDRSYCEHHHRMAYRSE